MSFAKINYRLYVFGALLSLLMMLQPPVCTGEEASESPPFEWNRYREIGEQFLKTLAVNSFENIRNIRLSYDVHMDLEAFVKTTMVAAVEIRREAGNYLAIFSLEEPVGKDLWSRFALFIYGKHTAEYKEMMKAVETEIHEWFHFQKEKFVTEGFQEILSDVKIYQNQTGIRVYFDYNENLIQFWEDQTTKDFTRSIPYSNQYGPLTAFFNYLLFEPAKTEIQIINALKQVEDSDFSGVSLSEKKVVNFLFEAQLVRIQNNDTGRYPEYDFAVYLEGENYLDIIYGKNIFFKMAHDPARNTKIPYAVHLDGIISKSRKNKAELRLKQLMERPEATRDFDRRWEEETLAAKNVKVYLTSAQVKFD